VQQATEPALRGPVLLELFKELAQPIHTKAP
jgi:hypothetical protein